MTHASARSTGYAPESLESPEPPDPPDPPDPPFSQDAAVTEILRQYWGFERLRPLQAEAIEAGRTGADSLVVLPTGGGKSLCYQVPPLLEEGRFDVVISPLIALMKDQVDGLRQSGYPAAALHSGQTAEARSELFAALRDRRLRLLFISPERLMSERMLDFLQRQGVRAFAIDEAHCISQWGHDFRREYRQLATLRERFANASLHAFTATATPAVRQDIIDQLGLRDPRVLVGTFDRPNLVYRVLPAVDVDARILEAVRRHDGEAVIVYCLSRRDADELAVFLRSAGVRAAAYHAGMDSTMRAKVQEAFAAERIDVVTATVAFGMGIDRSNVRCVIHSAMPKSIEHYQQETGRAGRDGLEAECILFHTYADVKRWERLISQSAEQAEDPDALIESGCRLLERMSGYCRSAECRHRALSRYFGQAYLADNCEACDVCLGEVSVLPGSTVTAQKILSCVARMGQSFGVGAVVEVLRGSRAEKVLQRGHDQLTTHGILRDLAEPVLKQLVYQLIEQGFLEQSRDERPVVRLTGDGVSILKGAHEVRLTDPRVKAARRSHVLDDQWKGVDRDLFEVLRELRRTLAEAQHVPAYQVFSDTVLRILAARRPSNLEQMERVPGIGQAKLQRYGEDFLEAIRAFCIEHDREMDVAHDGPAAMSASSGTRSLVKRPRGGSAPAAIELYAGGATVEEVAAETGRTSGTAWQYLHQFIELRRPPSLAPWVDEETYRRVVEAMDEGDGDRLKPLHERLEGQVPYEVIRAVKVHLAAERERAEAMHGSRLMEGLESGCGVTVSDEYVAQKKAAFQRRMRSGESPS